MEQELAANLLACARAYGMARGLALTTVGRFAAEDTRFFSRLDTADSNSSFTARKYDAVMAWFSDNWPEGAAWPAGVPRPARDPGKAA